MAARRAAGRDADVALSCKPSGAGDAPRSGWPRDGISASAAGLYRARDFSWTARLTSEGLLLLTNDGETARKLELPMVGWPLSRAHSDA